MTHSLCVSELRTVSYSPGKYVKVQNDCVILCLREKDRSRSNKKYRVESSSCCFVLVKQSHWMHKSMCVFFSSLSTCWSLRIHVLFQALSLLMSALYCSQSAFPHCLHTRNQTQAQSPNHNTHTTLHPNLLQPNIQQLLDYTGSLCICLVKAVNI